MPVSRKKFPAKAQRRKEEKRQRLKVSKQHSFAFLCAFAPWRETVFVIYSLK
jgi:hypothetical protein